MKKYCAFLLIVLVLAAAMPVALAENTTTLTTTVPDATYTLNIPADQTIEFNATETEIGSLTVTEASGFAEGKNLAVTITYGAFIADGVATTIPMELKKVYSGNNIYKCDSGDTLVFRGNSNGSVDVPKSYNNVKGETYFFKNFMVKIWPEYWGKALGGTYSSTITFTAEVVKE